MRILEPQHAMMCNGCRQGEQPGGGAGTRGRHIQEPQEGQAAATKAGTAGISK